MWSRLGRTLVHAARQALRHRGARPSRRHRAPTGPGGAPTATPAREYRMPASGLPTLRHEPHADGEADPGEVVWAWVPYEEDAGRGKDRPVLIVARVHGGFLGLQLTSKDHSRTREVEASQGRYWMDIGSGGWDAQRRDSEVRLDRLIFLPPEAVRREGAALDRGIFLDVVHAVADLHARAS